MNRNEVYNSINSEREYQENLIKNPARLDIIEDFHIADALSAIKFNLDKAIDEWYKDSKPYTNTTEFLRKIAGICVKVGEDYGMNKRQ